MTTSYPYGYRRWMTPFPILRLCESQEDDLADAEERVEVLQRADLALNARSEYEE